MGGGESGRKGERGGGGGGGRELTTVKRLTPPRGREFTSVNRFTLYSTYRSLSLSSCVNLFILHCALGMELIISWYGLSFYVSVSPSKRENGKLQS